MLSIFYDFPQKNHKKEGTQTKRKNKTQTRCQVASLSIRLFLVCKHCASSEGVTSQCEQAALNVTNCYVK